jgi:enterochelin esterase-like enzyme
MRRWLDRWLDRVRTSLSAAGTVLLATGCAAPAAAPPHTDQRGSAPPGAPGSVVRTVTIPAPASGFRARDAEIYLPPDYFQPAAPPEPVLLVLSGVPGDVGDWFDQGDLKTILDDYAAQHGGRAPVVVAADDAGVTDGDLLCMDSPLGEVDGYLSTDVPGWATRTLRVRPGSWAVAGISYGGTCALELAVRHPQLFPTFLDLSGEDRPMHDTREAAVQDVFDGDDTAYDRQDPLLILREQRFPGSAGVFAVGDDDEPYTSEQPVAVQACGDAGMQVQSSVLAGGHGWDVWSAAFRQSLPWLADRMAVPAGPR